jgi:hypothetical protein
VISAFEAALHAVVALAELPVEVFWPVVPGTWVSTDPCFEQDCSVSKAATESATTELLM